MKKLLTLILALALIVTLSACNGADDENGPTQGTSGESVNDSEEITDDTTQSDTIADNTVDTYTLTLDNGVTVTIGGPADEFIALAGEPLDYMEAPSCIHEGFDKVYTFDGYSVTTSPSADGEQYIAEISLISDAVALENGLMIGSDSAVVEVAFGTNFEEQFGVRKYILAGAAVSIIFDGDIVTGITISSTNS